MKLKFTRNSKLWIPNLGIYNPEEIVEVTDKAVAKKMLATGYFKEIKEIKEKKLKTIKEGDDN